MHRADLASIDSHASINGAFDASSVGVWIDPIDSTASYIACKPPVFDSGICTNSESAALSTPDIFINAIDGTCVALVLIGVFDLETGNPILGTLTQPYFEQDSASREWRSRTVWGLAPYKGSAGIWGVSGQSVSGHV